MRKARILAIVAATLMFGVACTLHKPEAPPLTGPSEFAQSMSIRATPDSISQDGGSQSSIVITVLDPNGKGISGLSVRVDMQVNGVLQDFGTLSARTVVTDNNGRATAIYTAPPPPPGNLGGSGTVVQIVATIMGTNFIAAQTQNVLIRLMPVGVILPSVRFVPQFTISPAAPAQGQPVTFDASTTTDPDGAVVSYSWDFGDGQRGTGKITSHTYSQAGAFSVTLTVADAAGRAASTTKGVTVGGGAPPTADFTFSPSTPGLNQDITFVATAQSSVPGHSIVSYDWTFGSGAPRSGQTVTKSYDTAGTYTVNLTVTDDLGLSKVVTKTVTVAAVPGGLFASFTFSPTNPAVGTTVSFNASSSTGNPVRYDWDFGDGATASLTTPTTSHVFNTAASYVVRLTVFDSAGRSNATTSTVTVAAPPAPPAPAGPTADFTFSPTTPNAGQVVNFDGTISKAGNAAITTYRWNFGDGFITSGPPATHGAISHTYLAGTPGTTTNYNVTLTVTDANGLSSSKTQSVPVKTP
jgi:PKD repeat protein